MDLNTNTFRTVGHLTENKQDTNRTLAARERKGRCGGAMPVKSAIREGLPASNRKGIE
jgi:hypothetical protein